MRNHIRQRRISMNQMKKQSRNNLNQEKAITIDQRGNQEAAQGNAKLCKQHDQVKLVIIILIAQMDPCQLTSSQSTDLKNVYILSSFSSFPHVSSYLQ